MLSAYSDAKKLKKQISRLKKQLKLEGHQSYYYAWWSSYQSLSLAMLKNQEIGSKLFIRMHGYDLYFERHPANYLPFRSYLFEQADLVLFISEQGKKYIQEKLQRTFSNHTVSRLGTRNSQKPQYRILTDELMLVSCSNLIPLKRVHLIIEALALLPENLKLRWKHFGEGPLLENLKTVASTKLEPLPNISYSFEGYVNNQNLLTHFAENKIDLFINVSETEGIPVSIMEVFSYGIPAIATDVGGVCELVNPENGYLLPKDTSPGQIADTIAQFFNLSAEDRLFKQKKAYEKWHADFNAEKNFNELAEKVLKL